MVIFDMHKQNKMKNRNLYRVFFLPLFLLWITGCSKNDDSASDDGAVIKQGTLYYSAADQLIQYDFQSKTEIALFSDGDHYRVSPDAKRFLWYKNNFSAGTTQVQVHSLGDPSDYESINLPYILEQTPRFIPGSNALYAALVRAADGAVKREDLLIFNSHDNTVTGRIPHVKAFAVLPNGQDLILSAEAFDASGTSVGFALAVIKQFQSTSQQSSFTIQTYPDYAQLPEDIAVSPDGQELVFTQTDHLFTVAIKQDTQPRQITQSRFREVDASWSKDGKYIVFTASVSDPARDCGEIRIIPAHPENPIPIPDDGANNEPVDDLQPTNGQGKVIHACGSESYLWL